MLSSLEQLVEQQFTQEQAHTLYRWMAYLKFRDHFLKPDDLSVLVVVAFVVVVESVVVASKVAWLLPAG